MAKKPKFKLGAEVRRIARDKMPPIPAKRVIPNKKKEVVKSYDSYEEYLDDQETYGN
jgi:hypothetical protein